MITVSKLKGKGLTHDMENFLRIEFCGMDRIQEKNSIVKKYFLSKSTFDGWYLTLFSYTSVYQKKICFSELTTAGEKCNTKNEYGEKPEH